MVNYWVVRMTLSKEDEKVIDFQVAEKGYLFSSLADG